MKISFIIPVFNEEIHIEALLVNLKRVSNSIFIVDSGSTDKTLEIGRQHGCSIYVGKWDTFSEKLNWAIEHTPYQSEWVMRVDGDELLSDELIESLINFSTTTIPNESEINYLIIKKDFYFLGRQIRHGGYRSLKVERIFKRETVRYENRRVDEHLVNITRGILISGSIIENSRASFQQWLSKHIMYAEKDVQMVSEESPMGDFNKLISKRKIDRFLKISLYGRLPLFIRPFLYWVYRYLILLGFLDGKAGFVYHTFHAFIYRQIQDTIIYEKKLSK